MPTLAKAPPEVEAVIIGKGVDLAMKGTDRLLDPITPLMTEVLAPAAQALSNAFADALGVDRVQVRPPAPPPKLPVPE